MTRPDRGAGAAGGPAALAFADCAAAYGRHPVLDGVSLALAPGETVALLGPNGAGKTALLRLAAGRLPATRGTVRVAGRDPHREAGARRLVGYVPQDLALYRALTVRENLGVFDRLAGLRRSGRGRRIEGLLALADLGSVADRPVETLSGGFRRRADIAAALSAEPRVLLLDEPCTGLDRGARGAVHEVIARLRRSGAAILIATHDFDEAERVADRVAILRAGRLALTGDLADLLSAQRRRPAEREAVLADPAGPSASAALARAGFAPAGALVWRSRSAVAGDRDGAALLAFLRDEGVPVREMRVHEPGLESLYADAIEGAA